MPKARAKQWVGFRGAAIAVLLALGALAIWYGTVGRSAGRMEEFMSYRNVTAFTEEQVWESYRVRAGQSIQCIELYSLLLWLRLPRRY